MRNKYRLRQYYESKVPDFWQATVPLEPIILKQIIRNYHSPFQYAYFDTFGEEIGRLYSPKSIFKAPWEIEFWSILLQNGLKSQFLRKLKRWLWNKKLTNFSFEGVKSRASNVATTFCNIFRKRWAVKNQATSVLCSTLDSYYWRDLYSCLSRD